jgi:tetratricopeptide (TPR) repeat protein
MTESDDLPGDDRPAAPRDMLLEELARLREEVVAARNVINRTDNYLKGLSTEVKSTVQRQTRTERRAFLNSVFAYLIFSALIFVGLYMTFDARVEKYQVDRKLFEKEAAVYKREIAELKADLGRWKQIERELLEFERMVKDGNKEAAVSKFSSLRSVRFSGLLEDLIVRFKAEVAEEKYERGKTLYQQGNFDKADEAFLKSLEYNEEPRYLGKLLYYQGMSALRMKDFPRSAELLRAALGHDHEYKVRSDASYHLAFAHDRMGEKRTAKDLYFRFFDRYRKHPFAKQAQRRFEQLKGGD